MRILYVGSSGGHLAQMLPLARVDGGEHHWVTFATPDAISKLADESVTWGHFPTTRNLPNLVRNWRQARSVLDSFRPDVVVSTGAGIALPYFVLARRRGIRTIYLEVIDRIATRTLTGRLVYPFTNEFLVQWDRQQPLYPDSVVAGPVI